MNISWSMTERGFKYGEFRDQYDAQCSIQESSLATEECIWLGISTRQTDRNAPGIRPDFNERMHLSREMAAELWPLLQRFAETGELGPA